MNTQELPATLQSTLQKLKRVSEKYSSKSALGKSSAIVGWQPPFSVLPHFHLTCVFSVRFSAADYPQVSEQVKQLEEESTVALAEVTAAKSILGRVLSAWDSYSDCLSSLQAWLQHSSTRLSHGHRADVLAARIIFSLCTISRQQDCRLIAVFGLCFFLLVDLRVFGRVGVSEGSPERGSKLPDGDHRPSDQQAPGGGAASLQPVLDGLREDQHVCKSTFLPRSRVHRCRSRSHLKKRECFILITLPSCRVLLFCSYL